MSDVQPLLPQLVALLDRPVEEADRRRAQLHLLDWLACAALGASSDIAAKLRRHLQVSGAPGTAMTFGLSGYHWADALWYNAAIGNVVEMDDVHRTSTLHPGPVVIPAALAAAQLSGASSQKLLEAIVIGYEAMIRIGRALGRDHYAFFHNTSTCGAFGAAAAASYLLDLNTDQRIWALANAGTRTGGLWQMRHEPTDSKQLHNAEAARTGVQAALLAREGVRGPASLLDGQQGFFAATSPEADRQAVVSEPEAPWQVYQCSFKPWPACRHAHAAIDAAIALGLGPRAVNGIAAIELETFGDALVFCDRPQPQTSQEARFSLQHCIAVTLLEGRPALAHFEPGALSRTEYVQMRNRVKVKVGKDLDRNYPQHFGARLTVRLSDGSHRKVLVRDAWGDPENPMAEADIKQKAVTLFGAGGVAPDAASDLVNMTLALADVYALQDWLELLARATAAESEVAH